MKKIILTLTLFLGLLSNSETQAQGRIGNIVGVLTEISALADEFNLTAHQKSEMRSVLMDYLPNIALKANAMMNNRKNLISSNVASENNDDYMFEIAEQQGRLLTGLIISKEHMKKEIKAILTEEQQGFVEDLLTTIINYRMSRS